MGMMGEQHNKKGGDWLELYQYRVKSMASSNARLLSQVCSLRYETQNLQTSYHQDLTHSYRRTCPSGSTSPAGTTPWPWGPGA